MLAEFLTNINRIGCAQGPVLLAVSGGVDSVVLVKLFKEAGVHCGIAHCNFQLRGSESDADAALVKKLADEVGYCFHEILFDTKAAASRWKMSTQMTARKLRYDWFAELVETHRYAHVATGHHGGDQVETVLLNLARGSGLRGLQGMPEVNGRIVRPLLFATREQIVKYANQHQLAWREDRSNADDHYRRNRVRNQVVPVLKSINPSLEQTVFGMVEKLRDVDALLNEVLGIWRKEVWTEDGATIKLNIEVLRRAVRPAYQLYYLLEPLGFSSDQVNDILHSLETIAGKEFHSETHLLIKDREFLVIERKGEASQNSEELAIRIEILPPDGAYRTETGSFTGYFDAKHLKMPLRVRNWERGDTFQPYGMGGRHKKVSDLLVDMKVNRLDKTKQKVLLDGDGRIVWVVGLRGGHLARITSETKSVAKVSLSKSQAGSDSPGG
jgi:tRNA(Ile)-lysidine synthase